MKDKLKIKITKQDSNKQLKKYLSENLKLSRRVITRLYTEKNVLVNNGHPFLTTILNENDILEINFVGKDVSTYSLNNNEIDILYEDEYILVVDKPSGILAHPSKEHKDKDLSILLKKKYGNKFILRSIGRLDKDVSGIMLLAKTNEIASLLNKQKEEGLIHKYYACLVNGLFNIKKDTLIYYLEKDEKNHKYIIDPKGKKCITDYEVIKENNNLSLLKIEIKTGRTHQIRAGMASINHTIVGDILYGDNHKLLNRIGLHSNELIFKHPVTNKEITIKSKLPKDIESCLIDKVIN